MMKFKNKAMLCLLAVLGIFAVNAQDSSFPESTSSVCKGRGFEQFCPEVKFDNDYLLVVDASSSMKRTLWYTQLISFLMSIKCAFADNERTRFGLLLYSANVKKLIPIGKYDDETWIELILDVKKDKSSCCSQGTPLAEALGGAYEMLTDNDIGYKKTVLTVSDGVPVQIICDVMPDDLKSDGQCWQTACYNEVGDVKDGCRFPNYMDMASYVFRHIQKKAAKLRSIARHMLIGVPNRKNDLPDEDYFAGRLKANGEEVCITRRGTGFTQCISAQDGGYDATPLVSEPVTNNVFTAKTFAWKTFTDLILNDICTPPSIKPQPPIAVDDTYTVQFNAEPTVFTVIDNDQSECKQQAKVVSVSKPNKGGNVVIINPGSTLLYKPPKGFDGNEIFTYTIEDCAGQKSTATVTVTIEPCTEIFDLLFIVDESNSIDGKAYDLITKFLATFVDKLTVGKENVRLGLIMFSERVRSVVTFSNSASTNVDQFKLELVSVGKANGFTATSRALQRAMTVDYLNHPSRSSSGDRANIATTVVLITDGKPNRPMPLPNAEEQFRKYAELIRGYTETQLIAIGISDEVDQKLLDDVSDVFMYVSDFGDLNKVEQKLLGLVSPCQDY